VDKLEEMEALRTKLQPRLLDAYMPHKPTPKQAAFLLLPHEEAFYGGAAGGGKSDALLMAALQYVDQPDYNAILFRRTFQDLSLPGALIDRATDWLHSTDARWLDKDKRWTFPSGATLSFGYLEHEKDKFRYQGSEFQFIGFDELTQFTESQYRYLHSRIRRLEGSTIPLRMRGAANPGGVGHEWVRQRFVVEGRKHRRIFIPAGLKDNPHLDQVEYRKRLQNLDTLERLQLLHGDWSAKQAGSLFDRLWFQDKIIDSVPDGVAVLRRVRYWDLAATDNHDSDYTVGLLIALGEDGNYYVLDLQRFRATPQIVERRIQEQAYKDGKLKTVIWMEQEPGSGGVNTIDHYRRRVLRGFVFKPDKPTGKKTERARPVSAASEGGLVFLIRGTWINSFLDELEAFPNAEHKDQVDAFSGAYIKVSSRTIAGGRRTSRRPSRSLWG
jgi:predicted phage terminase large subunit-like protein